ncbi:MAG: hypothetical protein ACE5FI_07425 [Anaerolineales bacterium]
MDDPSPTAGVDPQRLLHTGVELIQTGDQVHGRAMLLEAVEIDPGLAAAWRWLGEILISPEDRALALEKYLALRPEDSEAAGQLSALQLEIAGPATDPAEDDISFSPLQCVYCGALTDPDDRRCPVCERSLMTAPRKTHTGWIGKAFFILAGWDAQIGVILAAIPFMAAGPRTPILERVARISFVQATFTDFLDWPQNALPLLTAAGVAHALLLLAPIVALAVRDDWSFRLAFAAIPLDLVLLAAGASLGYVGLPMLGLHLAVGLSAVSLAILALANYATEQQREFTELQRTNYSSHELHKLGHEYRRKGKWALATLAWQRAVAKESSPRNYFQLGIGYAHLGHTMRAVRALREAQRLAPDNVQIAEAVTEIERADANP